MKKNKFLSVVLAGALTLSSGFTAIAEDEVLNLTDLYASKGNIYLTYDKTPTADEEVVIVDDAGENVEFTAVVQDDGVLRITPKNELTLDSVYSITTGNAQKRFRVKTLKSDDFSDNDYTDTLDFYPVGAGAINQSKVGIVDGKLLMQQRYVSFFTIKDGLVNKLDKFTVEFDMETYVEHMAAFMFNKTIKNAQFRYGSKTAGVDEIGWIFGAGNTWAQKLFRYERTDTEQTPAINGNNSSSYKDVGKKVLPSTYKIAYDDSTKALSIDTTDGTRLPETVNYTIDKMGKTGVLSMDGEVSDVYSKDTAASTGYFFIGSNNSWNTNTNTPDGRGISLDNILITTCEIIPDLTDVYASPKNIYLTFDGEANKDIDFEITDETEQKVSIKETICDDKTLILTPQNKLDIDEVYTVIAGDKKMAFEIKQLLFEDFEDDTVGGETVAAQLSDALFVHKGASALSGIVDIDGNKKAILTVQGGSFFTLKDGLVNNLKNYTVDFDMETYGGHRTAIAINRPIKDTILRYGTKTEGIDEIGWLYCANGDNYIYRYYRDDAGYNGLTNDNGSAYTLPVMGSNKAMFTEFKVDGTQTVPATQKISLNDSGEFVFTEQATDESQKVAPKSVNYTVDKMGKVGVLSMDDVYKDTYTRENAATTGYFFVGAGNSWGENDIGFTLDNIRVTTCKSKEILPDPDLTDVYASKRNVYLTFNGEPSEDIDVTFTDIDGAAVQFEKTVQEGNVLRLTPETSLEIGKYYTVEVGTVKKTFRVKELLKDDFSDGEYTDTLTFYDRNKSKAQIVDGKLYMIQNGLGYFIINDGVVNNLKNYSVEFDMETYKTHREAIVFNKVSKAHTFHWSVEGDSYHGWVFESEMNKTTNDLHRAARSTDQTNYYEATGISGTTVRPSTKKLTWDGTNIGIAETNESNPLRPEAVSYAVDKMGKTGVISMGDEIKDIYTNDDSNETGYFFIGSAYPGNYTDDNMPGDGFSLDNIVVTTCEVLASNISVIGVTAKDADGNDIEKLNGNDTVTGKVKIANMFSEDKSVVVVVAAYKGDTMINSTIATESTVQAGKTIEPEYTLTGIATADNLKVFCWDSFGNMVPWTEAQEKKKIIFDDEITIGFIGGSLTEGGTIWRNGVTDFFEEKYPDKTITAYSAGIGGTGSDMGAYRYERDILSKDSDIVFIDFAVNDMGKNDVNSTVYMENMVRKSLEQENVPYIVFLYTPIAADKTTSDYVSWKKGVDWKEGIARYYGIKSINIYDYMYAEFEEMKKSNESFTFNDYLSQAGYVAQGDGFNVHGGYEKYKEAILKALNDDFEACMTKPKNADGCYCSSTVVNDRYEYVEVTSDKLTFDDNWTKYTKDNKYSGENDAHKVPDKDFSYPYFPNGIMQTETKNATFTYKTTPGATGVMLSHISSSAGASATVYVDEESKGTFDCYSIYDKMNYTTGWIGITNDGKEHTVKVVVDGIGDDKTVFRFGAVIERK